MKAEHLDKIETWLTKEMSVLEPEKADDQGEEAIADLALRRVFGEHFQEISHDQDLLEETYALVSDKTAPSELREIALQARKQCKARLGYYLQVIAEYREEHAVSGKLF